MKYTSEPQAFQKWSRSARRQNRRWLHPSLLWAVVLAASYGCRDDGPTYGEIDPNWPRSGGDAGGETSANEGGDVSSPGGERSSQGGQPGVSGVGGAGGTHGGTPPVGGSSGGSSLAGTAGSGGMPPVNNCGNGTIDAGETCDDSNAISGDGCSAQCQCACEACEQSEACFQDDRHLAPGGGTWFDEAYHLSGTAQQGPAPNAPKVELFRNLMDCVRETKCVLVGPDTQPMVPLISLVPCYCLNPVSNLFQLPPDCSNRDTFMPGPCLTAFEEAAEADTVQEIFEHTGSIDFAVGYAYWLIQACDVRECRTECFSAEQTAQVLPELADTTWDCDNCSAENACMAEDP